MIKKIIKLKKLGLFNDYQWDSALQDFRQYNLIYGWNGSGKTTLAKLFACLETGSSSEFPNLEYEIKHEGGIAKEGTPFNQKIRVFTQDYIKKNVQIIDGKANPIVILGEENKEIADKIKIGKETLTNLKKQKSDKEVEKRRKESEKDRKFTDVAKIIGSSTRTYRKPDAEKDFESIIEKKILTNAEVEKQKIIIHQEQKDTIDKIIFNTDLDLELSSIYDEITDICKETVEINVIDRLAENQKISSWVEHGLNLHTEESEQCEFCGSDFPNGRIKALLGHFNEADKKIKIKIDAKITNIQQTIQSVKDIQLPNKAQFYTDLQTSFTSQELAYNQEKENYCAELLAMVEVLKNKKQKTTEQINFSRLLSNDFQSACNFVNETIEQHNKNKSNFQAEKDKAAKLLKTHYLSEIYVEIHDLNLEIEECEKEILIFKEGDENTSIIGITELEKQITENQNKISSTHNACTILNKNLQTFLGRDEIVFEVAPGEGYVIKRNGIIAENLSEGEKTAIAFVYFVVQLQDQDFVISNGIIVIDDPISSLDSNSLFQAFAFLKCAVKDAKQVFIFTHNFSFLRLILNWFKNTERKRSQYYMIKNQHSKTNGRAALITNLDKELKEHESEYHYLFKILYTFETDGSIASVYHIPNIARKVLDTFLMFSIPNSESSHKKMEKLNFDEAKKMAIYKFTNDQSHISGDGLDPSLVPETEKNVRYLLEMIETVSPEHYKILEKNILESLHHNKETTLAHT